MRTVPKIISRVQRTFASKANDANTVFLNVKALKTANKPNK